jgi:hypothetical protein
VEYGNQDVDKLLSSDCTILVHQPLAQCPHEGVSPADFAKFPCLFRWYAAVFDAKVLMPFKESSLEGCVSINLQRCWKTQWSVPDVLEHLEDMFWKSAFYRFGCMVVG